MQAKLSKLMEEIKTNGIELIVKVEDTHNKLQPYEIIAHVYNREFFDVDKLKQKVTCLVNGTPIAKMGLSMAILNSMLLSTLRQFGFKYNRDLVFIDNGNIHSQDKYLNMIKNKCFLERNMVVHKVNQVIGRLKEAFAQFAIVLTNKEMRDISMLDFIELCSADKDIRKWILDGPVNQSMSLETAENTKKHTLTHLTNVINEKRIEPWYSILNAGVGVRKPQLIDCLFAISSRPNKDVVIPRIMETSWLRGITDMEEFFIEAYISRAALIITKLDIRDPGAFQKMISYLNNPNYLNKDKNYMCDSQNPLIYTIDSDDTLKKLHDRYMVLHDDVTDLHRIDYQKDKNLIGKTVAVRSPQTCNSKDGICRYCVGRDVWEDNVSGPLGANSNFGVTLVKRHISPKGQDFLSSKHNTSTNIVPSDFIHSDEVDIDIRDVDRIYSNSGDISVHSEDMISEEADRIYYRKFYVIKNGLEYEVESKTGTMVFMKDDGFLRAEFKNESKSATYIKIKEVFENTKRFIDPVGALNKLLGTQFIVGETLLRNMLYTKDRQKPDWSKKHPIVEWVSHKAAALYTDGIVNKLPCGFFKRIISSPRNYKRTAKMPYDSLFANRKHKK